MRIIFLLLIIVVIQLVVTARQIRVTCIGDSITEGGGCLSESYTDVLQSKLGGSYSVLNAGVSGRTMLKKGLLDGYTPFSYWDSSGWQTALESDPDIVTILLGTNDAKSYNWEGIQQNTGDYYTLDYIDMIKQLRKKTNVKEIFVMIPMPLFEPYPFDMNGTIVNSILPTVVRNVAEVANVKVIDLFTPLVGKNYTCDNCHPTHDANVVIADTMFDAITKK
jgi:acyl-CoA thioesterase-1